MLPVAELMDELVATINGGAYQDALGGACPARRGYQETQDQKEQGDRSIWISPEGWRSLGHAGDMRLEQHTLNLRIVRTQHDSGNEAIDRDIESALELRKKLECWQSNSTRYRVEQVLGPVTIDRAKLAMNQSSVALLLDCDILTGRAYDVETYYEDNQLTVARMAVWDAICAWSPLESSFRREYRNSEDLAELQLRDPGRRDLPAIALYWGDIKPEWRSNRMQEWPLTLRLSVWVAGDQHTYAEKLLCHVFDAIYQAKREGQNVPIIERATGYPPRRVNELTIQSVTLGRAQQIRALRADVAFALRSNKDPFGDT